MASHVFPILKDDPAGADKPVWARLLRHSAELGVAGFCTEIGIRILGRASDPANFYAGPFQYLPTSLTYLIGLLVTVGGLLAITGLAIRIRNLKLELAIEVVGWLMLLTACAAYVWGAYNYHELTGNVTALTWIGAICAAKCLALHIHIRVLLRDADTQEKVTRIIKRAERASD